MVKVRIEYKGQVREFEKDAVIAFFSDKERAQAVFAGGRQHRKSSKNVISWHPEFPGASI